MFICFGRIRILGLIFTARIIIILIKTWLWESLMDQLLSFLLSRSYDFFKLYFKIWYFKIPNKKGGEQGQSHSWSAPARAAHKESFLLWGRKGFFPLCSPAHTPHAVCTAPYIALASSDFMLSRQQHCFTWKGSSNLYVLQFLRRFTAVGCFQIELHREGGRTERHFLCVLSGSKFSCYFLISHCW